VRSENQRDEHNDVAAAITIRQILIGSVKVNRLPQAQNTTKLRITFQITALVSQHSDYSIA